MNVHTHESWHKTVEEYDSFRHLGRALFWSVDQVVFALTFYGDDAGKTDDNDYVIAAGFLGTVAQWDRFSVDWRLQLARVNLPYFHASPFFTGADVYAGWNTDERKNDRETLLKALGQIIEDYTLHSFTAGIHIAGWVKANEEYMLQETGFSAFPLAARLVVQRTRQWAEASNLNPTEIEFIFDQGCEDWGKLQRRLKVDFGIDAIDRDKKKIRPLQAADWLAYEEFREIPKRFSLGREKMRGSYLPLLRVPFDPIVFHYDEIITSICQPPEMKVPKRSAQGTRAVRFRYDYRKMDRAWRRYGRFGKKLDATYPSVNVLNSPPVADEYRSSDPTIAALQNEVEEARRMIDFYGDRSTILMKSMRADSQQDQDQLHNEFLDAMRAQREWTEKHITALEKLAKFLNK